MSFDLPRSLALRDVYAEELTLLAGAQDWSALRAWFSHFTLLEEKVAKCLLWGHFFLPSYFRDPSPEFHFELVAKQLSDLNEFTACPRGFGKTTVNQLCISFEVSNQLQQFIVIVEKSFNEASEVLFAVRDEFKNNPMILQVYGQLVKANTQGVVDEKNKDAQGDVLINGVRLRAKGFNSPIRGLKSKEWRPTKIYIDDVEEDEHIRSEEQRRKYRENYAQGIVPAVDIKGTIKVTGTILHNDSLLMSLIEQHKGIIFSAYDIRSPEATLLWGERWTLPLLEEKRLAMENEGLGSSKFYQEYLNQPFDEATRKFSLDWMNKTFTEIDLKLKARNRFITIDVAESKKDSSDYTGVAIVDLDQEGNWLVQFVKRYRVNSAELVELIFNLWENWKPQRIGVEKNSFHDQVEPWLKQKREELGVFPIVVELEDGGRRKEDRIVGALQGRFQSGKIWFKEGAKDDSLLLKGELNDFPKGKHDDLADALAYISQLATRPFAKGKKEGLGISQEEKEFFDKKRRKTKSVVNRL